jgi:hypothetical protein
MNELDHLGETTKLVGIAPPVELPSRKKTQKYQILKIAEGRTRCEIGRT